MKQTLVGNHLKIDSVKRKVYFQETELPMPERTYRLLITLVENAPNIVSRDELFKIVWPDTVVSDETLKQRVSRLRRLLNDAGEHNDYFVAERGLGYRCTAPVVQQLDTGADGPQEKGSKHNRLFLLLVPTIVLALLLLNFKEQTAPSLNSSALTTNDYIGQAVDYYYRFNPEANQAAIELLHQAIALDPNSARGYAWLSNSYSQGYYQYGENEPWLEKAKQYAELAIEMEESEPWGYKAMGLAQHLTGRHGLAMRHYQTASEFADWWASPVNNLAIVLMESGDLVGAYHAVGKAIELGPKDPIPYLFLGLIYRDLKMEEHALKAINRSISFKPDYNLAQGHLAEYYFVQNEFELANQVLSASLEKYPNNQFAYWLSGSVALYQGDEEEAIMHFRQAALLGGDISHRQSYMSLY
jgi:DNA-binding winged helix-turn-helix (wHTH) protein/predicted Zn-dependent protease